MRKGLLFLSAKKNGPKLLSAPCVEGLKNIDELLARSMRVWGRKKKLSSGGRPTG